MNGIVVRVDNVVSTVVVTNLETDEQILVEEAGPNITVMVSQVGIAGRDGEDGDLPDNIILKGGFF